MMLTRLFRRKRPRQLLQPVNDWSLNAELLSWAKDCPCTVGQSLENILIMGGTGSGKTSASGRTIAHSMLSQGYGALVLTAKPDDRKTWEEYCRNTGRMNDLCVIEPGGQYRYNVLDSELQQKHAGGATHNIVALLTTVMDKAQSGADAGSGAGQDRFWKDGACQLLTNAVDLLLLSIGRVTVPDLYQLIIAAPDSMVTLRSDEWKKNSICFQRLTQADAATKSPSQLADFHLVVDYWTVQYPSLNGRTRSVFVAMVVAMLDKLNRGVARDLFCSDTTIAPAEAAADGKIVLIDLPILDFRETGTLCQVLVKTAFQRAILRRKVADSTRPVMLWSDEFQTVCTSLDADFLAVCRSARVSCVYLTQNLPNVRAAMGGGSTGEAVADGLAGNFNTKLFHANTCPVTNNWASSIVGRSLQYRATSNTPAASDWVAAGIGLGAPSGGTTGFNESMDLDIEPAVFTMFRTGGQLNSWTVDALLVQSGRVFPDTGKICGAP